jgi:release factor glutamine methyltransferase
MNIGEAERWLTKELATLYSIDEASAISSLVLASISQFSRSERALKKEEVLAVQDLHRLTEIHHRLIQHEPVQYILGETYFCGLKLYLDRNVLIPRPETEELVEWIVADVRQKNLPVFDKKSNEADKTTKLKILDVGTGSGCIALALKNQMPKAEIWGCDASDAALNIARRNGSELDIRVDFQGVDFLDFTQQKILPTVDIVVSNPPYIPMRDMGTMNANVLNFEPHTALFVRDEDELIFYKALANFGKERLYANGCIYTEVHENFSQSVVELFENQGYKKVEIKKDMQGKERMVKAHLNPPEGKTSHPQ